MKTREIKSFIEIVVEDMSPRESEDTYRIIERLNASHGGVEYFWVNHNEIAIRFTKAEAYSEFNRLSLRAELAR